MTIRKAQEADIPAIFSLVKDLAIYENVAEEVTVDIPYYKESFNNGLFEAIVAELDHEIIGTCIYYKTFSTWKGKMLYLEDFVVKEHMRKTGIGQQLYDQLINIARTEDYKLAKWQVLDWNEPAIKFYESKGANVMRDWDVVQLDENGIENYLKNI